MRKELILMILLSLPMNTQEREIRNINFSKTYFAKETKNEVVMDINKIINIESSGNPFAHNKHSGARGLMQVTPIVLEEWNYFNPSQKYTCESLFNPEINRKIGTWYLNRIKDHYIPYYGLGQNIENILIAYNSGIKNLCKMREKRDFNLLPKETQEYIRKYKKE